MLLELSTQQAITQLDNLLNDNQQLAKLIKVPILFDNIEKQHIQSLAKQHIDKQCDALLAAIGQLLPHLVNQSSEFQNEAMSLVESIEDISSDKPLDVKLLQCDDDWRVVLEEFSELKRHIQLVLNSQ